MPDHPERPHYLQREAGGPLEPASTEEIAPLIAQHAMHDGIAYFDDCPACQQARAEGRYGHWFPGEKEAGA